MEFRTLKELVDGLESAGITETYRLMILQAAAREKEALIDKVLDRLQQEISEEK